MSTGFEGKASAPTGAESAPTRTVLVDGYWDVYSDTYGADQGHETESGATSSTGFESR